MNTSFNLIFLSLYLTVPGQNPHRELAEKYFSSEVTFSQNRTAAGCQLDSTHEQTGPGGPLNTVYRETYIYAGGKLGVWSKYSGPGSDYPVERIHYSYNSSGRVETELEQRADKGQFVNATITTYTYDAGGRITTSLLKTRGNNNTLVNHWLTTYGYNSAGTKTLELLMSWDTTNSAWVNKDLISYKLSGKLVTEEHHQSWSGNPAKW